MTALAGLPAYLDAARVAGLAKPIKRHLWVGEGGQGWTDSQMVTSLVLLSLAGGDAEDDLRILEKDEGFGRVLRRAVSYGMRRKERKATEKRWRKERQRRVPSPEAVFRYLGGFHEQEEEDRRQAHTA